MKYGEENWKSGKLYEYGKVERATGRISELTIEELQNMKDIKYTEETDENSNYELLSEEEIENYIYMEEIENERKEKNNE